MTPEPKKPQTTTTIEISIAMKDKLHSSKRQLEEIINFNRRKKIILSYEDVLRIVWDTRSIDLQLGDLMQGLIPQ